MFHLMFVHYTFSSVCDLLENSLLGWPYVLIVFCLFVFFVYFPFCFETRIWLLIAPVPDHCYYSYTMIKSELRTGP